MDIENDQCPPLRHGVDVNCAIVLLYEDFFFLFVTAAARQFDRKLTELQYRAGIKINDVPGT